MSDDYSQTLGLNTVPADHDGSQGFSDVYTAALSQGQVAESFRSQYASVQEYLNGNSEAYANRRAAAGLTATNLRVISNVGLDTVWSQFRPSAAGASNPIFEWYAPRISDGIEPFQGSPEDIKFVVNHSFGRGRDRRALAVGQRTLAIDPSNGHSPERFFAGVRQLTNPDSAPSSRIARSHQGGTHHIISLRGDLINSVPWDNSCYHGEGSAGQYPGLRVNPRSIGIQHEEWFAFPAGARQMRLIEDQGPYNDAVYAVNAFILKKLAAYTGNNFAVYLGSGEIARQNIRNGVIGCFNHSSTSNHADPGAEFSLPPDYELRTTNLRSIPETQNAVGAWNRRIQRWYGDITTGTQISAYYRIFNIASRIRNYNLQTEVFDPSRSTSLIVRPAPGVTGAYDSAAAQRVATDSLTGLDRASRLAGTSRASMYDAAIVNATAVTTALARQSGRLSDVAERAVTLPVIVNALGFDYYLGLWVNQTSTRRAAGAEGPPLETPSPTTDVPATTAPPGDAPQAAGSNRSNKIALIGSSSFSTGNNLPNALRSRWGVEFGVFGIPGKSVGNYGPLPGTPGSPFEGASNALSNYGAAIIYFPGGNGVASRSQILEFTALVQAALGDNSRQCYWAIPPQWPTGTGIAQVDRIKTNTDNQAAIIQRTVPGSARLTYSRPQLVLTDLDDLYLHLTQPGAAKVAAVWPKPRTRT
jgi:hypothetical protein